MAIAMIIGFCISFGIVVLAVVISGGNNQCTKCLKNKFHKRCDNE